MATPKPVIVLVHGACHPPHFYRELICHLREDGYIVLAPPLPTTGLDDSVAYKTYTHDVQRIHEDLLPYLDDGRKAVLVCHSFGGIAGSAATENQTIEERKLSSRPGGIMAVVFIAAVVLAQKNTCFFASVGNRLPSFYTADGPLLKCDNTAADLFYDSELRRQDLFHQLVHQSRASIMKDVHFVTSDVKAPIYYIKCTKDKAIPADFQQEMALNSGCRIMEIESDHSPFLHSDATLEVVKHIRAIADESP
ncbi:hypothetical protein PG991_001754 [Apiospora marii]|uniref:AB hydrolase-1 domain-containing protein n=1 Tax=Apiospora marii TaxID=335849 RepID=A0ABR1SQK4_9PEZI